MRKYSEAQMEYMMARAAVEVAAAEMKARLAREHEDALIEAGDFEAAALLYVRIEDETGHRNARALLRGAESALIAWSEAVVQRLPQYAEHAELLAPMWDATARQPRVREQVVALAMQLDAPEVQS